MRKGHFEISHNSRRGRGEMENNAYTKCSTNEERVFWLSFRYPFYEVQTCSVYHEVHERVTGHLAAREFRHQPTRYQDFYFLY